MKIIEITRDDGNKSYMRLLKADADVPTEIAKWEAGGFTAVSWKEIQEADIPEKQPPAPTLAEKMMSVFNTLSVEAQAAFAIHRSAIKDLLEDDPPKLAVVARLIESVKVDESLADEKALLLSLVRGLNGG